MGTTMVTLPHCPAPQQEPASSPRTAFVLAGGAATGAIQAGMLLALYEHGIVPDLLVGTSVGALNAAFLASRPPEPATARELAALWLGLRRSDIFPLRLRLLLGGLGGRRDHLVSSEGLRRLITDHVQFQRLEHARIALHLITCDLASGQEVRLSAGPAADALLAASAIPGLLPPVSWRGRLLADGAIANNTPISHALQLGAQRIYVLPTSDPGGPELGRQSRSAVGAVVKALTLLTNARLHHDLIRYSGDAELVVLPAANPGQIPITDFGHPGELIELALTAARTTLAAGRVIPRADVSR